MKIHQSVSHLTRLEQKELRVITQELITHLKPEVIFCYGSRITHQIHRSCFTGKRRNEDFTTMYDLFIIVSDKDPSSEESLANAAERLVDNYSSANIIVHKAGFVNAAIENGNYFFTWLYRSAIILYDKNNSWLHFKDKLNKADCFKLHRKMAGTLKGLLGNMIAALELALKQKDKGNYAPALIQYNKALIYSCKAAILACLGYEITSMDFNRLASHTLNFTDGIFRVFPRNTNEEIQLFRLLSKSTITSLEGNERDLTEQKLGILEQRILQYILITQTTIEKYMNFALSDP